MRRAKEDDRLFLRQWRRIPALEAGKTGPDMPCYTSASARSKEPPAAVGSLLARA